MAQPFQSYGASYNSSPYYPQYQQYVGPQSSPGGYPQHGAPQMPGYQPSPALNIGRYDGSHQHPPAPNFSFSGPPINPEMFKQFASTVPPPPPPNFPPVPIPNVGFPQFQQNSTPVAPAPNHQGLLHSSHQPVDNDSYDPRYPQHIPQHVPQHVPQPPRFVAAPTVAYPDKSQTSDRRDGPDFGNAPMGPLADGQFSQTNRAAYDGNRYSSSMDGSAFSSQAQYQTRTFQPPALHAPQPIHTNISNTLERQTQQLNEGQEIEAAVKASSPKPPAVQNERSIPKAAVSEPSQVQIQKVTQEGYAGKSVSDLRGLAKDAILFLSQNGIDYETLAKEGVDKTILQDLYKELNVPIAAARSDQSASSAGKVDDSSTNSEPQHVTQAVPDNAQSVAANANISTTAMNTNQRATGGVSESVANAVKVPVVASPGLERKDRIAQLLAAKAGRASVSRSASESNPSPAPPETQQQQTHDTQASLPSEFGDAGVSRPAVVTVQDGPSLQSALQALRSDGTDSLSVEDGKTDDVVPQISIPSHDAILPSPLASSIPGLFMTSMEATQIEKCVTGASAVLDDGAGESRPSQKRTFDVIADATSGEPAAKRQNTLSTNAGDDAMAIDGSNESNASEGEILEDGGTGSSGQPPRSELQVPSMVPTDTTSQTQPMATKPGQKLTPQQLAEKAEMLKARFLKQRAERQKALRDGLPSLNAEVQKTRSHLQEEQSKLAEVRSRITQLGHDLVEAKNQEQTLMDNIQHLEMQVKEGVSGQNRYNDELRKLSTSQGLPKQNNDISQPRIENATERGPADDSNSAITSVPNLAMAANGDDSITPQNRSSVRSAPLQSNSDADANDVENKPENAAEEIPQTQQDDDQMNYASVTATYPEEVPMHSNGEENAEDDIDDVSDTFDYERPQTESLSSHQLQRVIQADVTPYEQTPEDSQMDDDDMSDGSASMSDSGSEDGEEDYEPAEMAAADPSILVEGDESDEYDPETAEPKAKHPNGNDEDFEDYEPAERVRRSESPDLQISEGKMVRSSSDAQKIEPPSHDNHNEDTDAKAFDPILQVVQHPEASPSAQQGSEAATPSNLPTPLPSNSDIRPLSHEGRISGNFTPYQSPLSAFQSFRYNQQFNETAKDGFRSLTYSNNINPGVPLCQTELAGGECQDQTCEDQHFRHLGLSDDQILVQMSNAQDIQDKSTRDRYLNGLKQVIADLRQDGVKEFESVATALSDYRRQFFAEQLPS